MIYNPPGFALGSSASPSAGADAPLIVVFERDDSFAVPLLSQLRMAGYDVRGARTPVELFDTVQKHAVALVLVDLGSAAAGRREFWVALDAQRRGRSIQVVTFRFVVDGMAADMDLDASARALADVEVRGPHELQVIIDAVRQRIPLHGGAASAPANGAPLAGMGSVGGLASANPFGPNPLGSANNGLGGPGANGYGGAAPGFAPASTPFTARSPWAAPTGMFGSNALPDGAAPGAPYTPAGAPGFPADGTPFGAAAPPMADQQSPFAHPANVNPFATGGEASPFDQPLGRNPFGGAVGPDGGGSARNPFAGPDLPDSTIKNPAMGLPRLGALPVGPQLDTAGAHEAVLGGAFGSNPGSNGHTRSGNGHLVAGLGVTPDPGRNNGTHVGDGAASGRAAVDDVWVPPGGDEPPQMPAPASPPPPRAAGHDRGADPVGLSGRPTYIQAGDTEVAFPTYDTAMSRRRPSADDDAGLRDMTAPISAQLPALTDGPTTAGDRALGTVLVEGALLSSQKLDVLRGIQRMLFTVDMDFKLGELALLFKFLSPDQLLAALLVSRGVVSPQQIAALGRIKQELGGSGMDYDLETLLIMFHILPAEELRALRQELS